MSDEDVSCWICLEDGTDVLGKPLMRDCSCRGSAGFAHISCIVKYAEQKVEQNIDAGCDRFASEEPWQSCPNCNQPYQNDLALELMSKYLSIASSGPGCTAEGLLYMHALATKLWTFLTIGIGRLDSDQRAECTHTAYKILSFAQEVKGEAVHPSPEYEKMVLSTEGAANDVIGRLYLTLGTEQSSNVAAKYFQKYKDIGRALGDTNIIAGAEAFLAQIKSPGKGVKCTSQQLKVHRDYYESTIKDFGYDSPNSAMIGIKLAFILTKNYRTIEAERLLSKLALTCRRVHGAEHDTTKTAESDLVDCKMRCIGVVHQGKLQCFQALRYEAEGSILVVKGPITKLKENLGDIILRVPVMSIGMTLGTPVICHGLMQAQHLNGKIGEVRNGDEKAARYAVYFEDPELKPCLVKKENIEILFELPGNDCP